eukprot:Gregarina_sp_Poly_1__572@NODE_1136_length_4979_cov_138_838966_g448_i1_p6_GENE_NODE_1136_length_4979_cov_138_838966_g448_i1NODE_1136_length_4979_cov_138_838966_g448_i1_p6_ORF_typecomplete_len144_score6_52_NODE_1136_length_4979_cov_138_838966_g448_i124402871
MHACQYRDFNNSRQLGISYTIRPGEVPSGFVPRTKRDTDPKPYGCPIIASARRISRPQKAARLSPGLDQFAAVYRPNKRLHFSYQPVPSTQPRLESSPTSEGSRDLKTASLEQAMREADWLEQHFLGQAYTQADGKIGSSFME